MDVSGIDFGRTKEISEVRGTSLKFNLDVRWQSLGVIYVVRPLNGSPVNKKLICNNPNQVNAYAKIDQIPQIYSQDIERNKIVTITKSHNCVVYLRKLTCHNPNLDLVNGNAYAKFGLIPSIRSQDIEQKQNSDDNQGP